MSPLAGLEDALRRNPYSHLLWAQCALELIAARRFEEAVACSEHAERLAPGFVEARYNHGVALTALGRREEALRCYETALALDPAHATSEDNRLALLVELGRATEAIPALEARLERHGRDPDLLVNLGLAHQVRGDAARARAAFEEALATQPAHRVAGWNLALLDLREGRLASGFRGYASHWPGSVPRGAARTFDGPQWQAGEPLAGRSILLHAEEGLGDTIQALRFVPAVADHASRVVLEVQRGMGSLARGVDPRIEVIEAGEALPRTDRHAPLHALPDRLGIATPEAIRPRGAYLRADARLANAWLARLGDAPPMRIGLAWRGNPDYPGDRLRSAPLAALRALFDVPGARLVSLQLRPSAEDERALREPGAPDRLGETASGMAQTAALIAGLDLVISVDTSIAHLAGALGRPVWILLGLRPDGRWRDAGEQSPWYPGARLFRSGESEGEAWTGIATRVRADLQRFVTLCASGPAGTKTPAENRGS